jgi:hypothetical protein
LEFARPFFVGIGFAVKTKYRHFLVSPSLTNASAAITVLLSEWPVAEILWEIGCSGCW